MDLSGQRKIGLYCTYDYQESLSTGKQTFVEGAGAPVHYLSFAPNTKKEFGYEEFGSLSEMMDSVSTGRNLLILVHGYAVDMKRFSKRMNGFADRYDVDVLTFFWPSNLQNHGNNAIRNFDYIRHRISDMKPQFQRFMSEVSDYISVSGRRVSIIFLSLANVFAKDLAYSISEGADVNLDFLDNIILNQACVPVERHTEWVPILSSRINGQLYIVSNYHDELLELEERLYHTGPKLGRGLLDGDKMAEGAQYRDFSHFLSGVYSPFLSHMYYIGPLEGKRAPVADFYYDAFHGR